ncbi:hypothetical protein GGE48_002121 [Rhizobium leguminosarum]|nr:hypothetical protein [Rhizobium leguminosarum]
MGSQQGRARAFQMFEDVPEDAGVEVTISIVDGLSVAEDPLSGVLVLFELLLGDVDNGISRTFQGDMRAGAAPDLKDICISLAGKC